MGLAVEVTLPRNRNAAFPNKCVVCHGKPDTTVSLAHSGTNLFWLILLPVLQLFTIRSVKAPICKACKPKFVWFRWLRFVGLIAIGLTFFFLMEPIIGEWPRIYQRILMIGVTFCIFIPYFLYEALNPPPFNISRSGENVDYEFRSEEYAREFQELNGLHSASATS